MGTYGIYPTIADRIPGTSITDKCVILDLDQTLIATQESMSALFQLGILGNPQLLHVRKRLYHMTLDDLEKPGMGTSYEFWGIIRPHVEEFLIFCFSYFRIVAVWSAGKRPYVEAIVDHLFRDLPHPHIIFTFDDIDIDSLGNIGKPITRMISSDDMIKRHMNLRNTLAIDDNPTTFAGNLDNGVLIPAYDPNCNIYALSQDDPCLLQLKHWLLQPEVIAAPDVSTLDKNIIFTIPVESYKTRLGTSPNR